MCNSCYAAEVRLAAPKMGQCAAARVARKARTLFEIVNDDFDAVRLERFFDKLDVLRVDLVIGLLLFVFELKIECNLVTLIHHIPVAGDHPANMEAGYAGDRAQVFFCAGDQFIGGVGFIGICPEDDDVREHEAAHERPSGKLRQEGSSRERRLQAQCWSRTRVGKRV